VSSSSVPPAPANAGKHASGNVAVREVSQSDSSSNKSGRRYRAERWRQDGEARTVDGELELLDDVVAVDGELVEASGELELLDDVVAVDEELVEASGELELLDDVVAVDEDLVEASGELELLDDVDAVDEDLVEASSSSCSTTSSPWRAQARRRRLVEASGELELFDDVVAGDEDLELGPGSCDLGPSIAARARRNARSASATGAESATA